MDKFIAACGVDYSFIYHFNLTQFPINVPVRPNRIPKMPKHVTFTKSIISIRARTFTI